MSQLLSVLASVLITIVMFCYARQVVLGTSTPNPATWLIWTVVTAMNTTTYFSVVQGNPWKTAVTSIVAFMVFLIFVYSLARGKFTGMKWAEVACAATALCVGVFWRITGDVVLANLLLQLVFLISFTPTVLRLLRNESREEPFPWDLAVVAYSVMIGAIVADWGSGSPVALAHPILNGIVGNGCVSIAIRLQQKWYPTASERMRVGVP